MRLLNDMSAKNGYFRLSTIDPDESPKRAQIPLSAHQQDVRPEPRPSVLPKHRRPAPLEHRSENDEMIEMVKIKPRRNKHRKPKSPSTKRPKQELIVEPLLPEDSLQRVSLRYGCPVAELRRVNKLYSDQDFHALKNIKIPVAEHSVLTESSERERRRQNTIREDKKSGTQSSGGTSGDDLRFGGPETYYSSGEESLDADDEYDDSDEPVYRDLSIHSALKWKHSRDILLNKVDEDMQRVKDNVEEQKANLNEIHLTMNAPTIHPVMIRKKNWLTFELPDWRIFFAGGLVVIVLISIFFVLVYLKPWEKVD